MRQKKGKTLVNKDIVTVSDLLIALKTCRPNAQILTTLYGDSDLSNIRRVEDCGNYVKLMEEK